nr:uncharacterized protein LOC100179133 [Ciona intestinalis]|eukprot:XP_002131199.1 uncharacterized protein LOC100179133 [Ciona intestinalis]
MYIIRVMRYRIFHFTLILCITTLICKAQNMSEDNDSETCGKSSNLCEQASKEKPQRSQTAVWKPFVYESKAKWVAFQTVFAEYVIWHRRMFLNADIPCHEKKCVVFTPNAGLGDSIGALSSAVSIALKTGRLLFINWKPYNWTVGLKALPFDYDYSAALNARNNNKPLICPHHSDIAAQLSGHITADHPLIKIPTITDLNFAYDDKIRAIVQPSSKVQHIVDSVISSQFESSNDRKNVQLVGLVMRTGEGEYNQFLSPGDEAYFVQCFRNYAVDYQKKIAKLVKFKVFVTSDNIETKTKVVNELNNQTNNGEIHVDVITLDDSFVHVMHVSEKNGKKKTVKEKIRKTYAEYFLIGKCDVLFLTHGSLFGRAAAERGIADERNVHFISDSKCDGKREKYSYLKCHEPKYPAVCNIQ